MLSLFVYLTVIFFCLSNRNFLLLCPCKFNKEQGRSGAQTPAAEAAPSEAGIDLADAERRVYGACGFHTRFIPDQNA